MALKLSVIGAGYLGATHAACMASLGFEVIGFDTEASKIALLSKGKVPFYEPELEELLSDQIKSGRLTFTNNVADSANADVHFICVGTPQIKNGNAALKYVRTREFDGLGDIGRMQRQQAFMSSVLKKATSAGVLLNPVTMTSFINSSLAAVTTDEGLKNSDLITLAKQMKSLATSNVRTLTVPLADLNYYSNGVTAAVLWDPVLAPELWDRLREDRAVIDEVTASPSPSSTKAAKVEIVDKFKSRTADDNICR